jgi:hypothetical protein
MELEGAVAVVTGAAQNIGRCIALTLAGEGCQVAALDLNEEGLGQLPGEVFIHTGIILQDPKRFALQLCHSIFSKLNFLPHLFQCFFRCSQTITMFYDFKTTLSK